MARHVLADATSRALTLAPGIIPLGLLFGATAIGVGLDLAQATSISATVFAGAAQFASAALLRDGASAWVIIGVVFIINSRYFLMTTAVLELARPLGATRLQRVLLSLLVVDESYALQSAWAATGGLTIPGMLLVSIVLWTLWCTSTIIGALMGALLPPLEPYGLDYALPGLFVGLFGIFAKDRPQLAIGLLALAASAVAAIAGYGLVAVVIVPPILAILMGRLRRNAA